MTFRKLLIANRGEIAIRIARAAATVVTAIVANPTGYGRVVR